MKAITLWQPRASLIAEGVKTIETRPKRSPWSSAIGEIIAIHAAAKFPKEQQRVGRFICTASAAAWWIRDADRDPVGWPACPLENYVRLPLGAVVATCRLVDVVPILGRMDTEGGHDHFVRNVEPADWPEGGTLAQRVGYGEYVDVTGQVPFGDFAPGRWALLLDEIVKLPEPISCRGWQGLWNLPEQLSTRVMSSFRVEP